MAVFGDDDIPYMLGDWGHSITIGGVTKSCTFAVADEEILQQEGGAGQIVPVNAALIRTSDFPNVKGGDSCVVDGANYTVWKRLRRADGTTSLLLRKV